MAFLDDQWFSGLQTAATGIATAMVGAVMAWLALRKKVSADSADIREVALKSGWLERLVKEREEQDARIESLRESQLNDARANARLEAEARACRERMEEAKAERDGAIVEMHQARDRLIAAEARLMALRDEALDLKLANGFIFKELASVDKDVAERLLVAHLRPRPQPNGEPLP